MDPIFRYGLNPHPEHESFGIVLHPLTLGHLLVLHELDSPIFESGQAISFPEIQTLISVCSRPHDKARKLLTSPLRTWWFGFKMAFRLNLKRLSRTQINEEIEKLWEYVSDSFLIPPVKPPKEKNSKTLCAPLEWRLLDMLMSRYRLTFTESLDVPLITAQCLWCVYREGEGKLELALHYSGFPSQMEIDNYLISKARQQTNAN